MTQSLPHFHALAFSQVTSSVFIIDLVSMFPTGENRNAPSERISPRGLLVLTEPHYIALLRTALCSLVHTPQPYSLTLSLTPHNSHFGLL
jgi:hypothetical protein